MELTYRKLEQPEIEEAIGGLSGWTVEGENLSKTYEFGTYLDGADWAKRAAHVAETLNHHPDLLLTWRKVKVSVHTHDVGGLSPYDFELARRLDAIG